MSSRAASEERPRHIPRFPRHPAVEHEEPSTGVYGAWCGAPLWRHQAVYDLVEASAIGREWSTTCACYGTMDYGQVFDPHPAALHHQPHPVKLCRACVQAATDALWASVDGGNPELVHCTYRDGDGVYCARPQADEGLCREHLVARSDFCCEWARADALGHPKVFGAGCDACVAAAQRAAYDRVWVPCTPALLRHVDCATTPRRNATDPDRSHEHSVGVKIAALAQQGDEGGTA